MQCLQPCNNNNNNNNNINRNKKSRNIHKLRKHNHKMVVVVMSQLVVEQVVNLGSAIIITSNIIIIELAVLEVSGWK